MGICYDIRFPELAMIYREAGAHMLLYPGCFNLTTGPAHWELLQRGRAVDNQCFVAAISQARGPGPGYQAYGYSMVTSPWGKVLAGTDEGVGIVYAEVDLAECGPFRAQVPISFQKRFDLYSSAAWKQ